MLGCYGVPASILGLIWVEMPRDLIHIVAAQERRFLVKLFLKVGAGLAASFSSPRAYPGITRYGCIGSRRSRRGGRAMNERMVFVIQIVVAALSSLSLPQPWGHHAPQSIHGWLSVLPFLRLKFPV